MKLKSSPLVILAVAVIAVLFGCAKKSDLDAYWSSEEYDSSLAKGWSFSTGKAVEGFVRTYSIPTRAVRVL